MNTQSEEKERAQTEDGLAAMAGHPKQPKQKRRIEIKEVDNGYIVGLGYEDENTLGLIGHNPYRKPEVFVANSLAEALTLVDEKVEDTTQNQVAGKVTPSNPVEKQEAPANEAAKPEEETKGKNYETEQTFTFYVRT